MMPPPGYHKPPVTPPEPEPTLESPKLLEEITVTNTSQNAFTNLSIGYGAWGVSSFGRGAINTGGMSGGKFDAPETVGKNLFDALYASVSDTLQVEFSLVIGDTSGFSSGFLIKGIASANGLQIYVGTGKVTGYEIGAVIKAQFGSNAEGPTTEIFMAAGNGRGGSIDFNFSKAGMGGGSGVGIVMGTAFGVTTGYTTTLTTWGDVKGAIQN